MIEAIKRKLHSIGRFSDIENIVGQFAGSFFSRRQHESSQFLSEILKTDRQWPYTRTPIPQSDGFSVLNARFFKGLFKVYGVAEFFALVKDPIMELSKKTDRVSQCTSAEILAGALRASVGNNESEALLQPILSQALSSSPPECIVDWMACIRFALYNRIPNTQPATWILNYLTTGIQSLSTSSHTSTAAAQAKPLYFLKAALCEFTWRVPSLHGTHYSLSSRSKNTFTIQYIPFTYSNIQKNCCLS